MKKIVLLTAFVFSVLFVVDTYAIDRAAKMIDAIEVEATMFDDADQIFYGLWGEQMFAVPTEDWSILIGGGLGSIEPDDISEDVSFWTVGLGLKYYINELTSIYVMGKYSVYEQDDYDSGTGFESMLDDDDNPVAVSGTVGVKHRFVSSREPISPYMIASITGQSGDDMTRYEFELIDGEYWYYEEKYEIPEVILSVGLGCDFMLTETLALNLKGTGFRAESELGDANISDDWGFKGSIAVVGYWGK